MQTTFIMIKQYFQYGGKIGLFIEKYYITVKKNVSNIFKIEGIFLKCCLCCNAVEFQLCL